jgi:hypothetical protein
LRASSSKSVVRASIKTAAAKRENHAKHMNVLDFCA